jgi:hypothetical protein
MVSHRELAELKLCSVKLRVRLLGNAGFCKVDLCNQDRAVHAKCRRVMLAEGSICRVRSRAKRLE